MLAWPVPVREIALVGHSMGGLVVHSALAQATPDWEHLVSATVTLGTPYLGAPLERGAAALTRHAEHLAPVRWLAELVGSRSEGIKDLGAGLGPHAELPPDPPGRPRRHYLVFATVLPGDSGRARDLAGDVIVPTSSAAGGYELPFADDDRVTVLQLPRRHHLDLLNDPVLHERLRSWLRDDRATGTAV